MNTSQIKDIIQKISFLKNYSSLLVSVIIGLVAVIILILVPVVVGGGLEKEVNRKSVSVGKRVRNLVGSAVSKQQVDEEKKYQDAYEEDANQVELLARQCSQRELLSYKIFPEPQFKSGVIFEEFGRNFCKGITTFIEKFNGGSCLTTEEINRIVSTTPSSAGTTSSAGSGGKSGNVAETIKDELSRQRAESISFYVDPFKLAGYEYWKEYKFEEWEKALNDCWKWQLGYWIIEDVIRTVGSVNVGSKSVLTSPVKRIISVEFNGQAKPSYLLSPDDKSFTARVCDDEIDVVHFNVVLLADSKSVLAFMKELCSAKTHKFRGFWGEEEPKVFKHNQITVLSSRINLINKQDKEHSLYFYGEDAIMELDITCEYIFNKNGYGEIKPVLQDTESKTGTRQSPTESRYGR
ncbi:MAG: hypothetical protein ACYSSI_04325 [Planctomycetota bacterium]|jgi:hypothetical protein